ncbi:G patch domain and ankyrin repeat-containing protein 1 homolog [Centruroides vittatus]|uniref:G patch domain and ankyrin repeat-containing protein 1 homolog n=1 Tax=Centruroides vittatus TaxID=120091 RepID=UPI0035108696
MLHTSFPFMPVTFVNGKEILNSTNKEVKSNNNNVSLDGNEIREFYEEIINTPSVCLPTQEDCDSNKKKLKIVKKSSSNTKIKPHDIFRYAENDDLKGIKECLNSGINVNCADSYGWTPLMCAACSGSVSVIKYLLRKSANRELRNFAGKKAIDLALQFKHDQVVELLERNFVNITSESQQMDVTQIYFCELCKIEVKENKQKHESSIIHQLNIRRSTNCYYHLSENNKGFQIMLKKGWDRNTGLGPKGIGNKYPIKTVLKHDRSCLGNKNKNVPRITHFKPFDVTAIERKTQVPINVRQNTLNKRERFKEQQKKRRKEISFRREFY